ncbi:CHAT domain-containing protein [Longimicrobium sp.]|jgi:TPR repeat protein|uniref:CHAT domain-containing protein n=1 Tax=Longimicrobium sp. TaxID=2029185 RepID=UPI002F94D3F6
MRKVKVLFFAADATSLSANHPRLRLDEEVRQIRKRVKAAVFGNMLDFDWRPATRTRDLQQALEDTRPQIVHFSGHGGGQGLVFMGADGLTPRPVNTEVLRELFEKDAGAIRLVVLTACHSRAQAQAICEVVGCAIGTRDSISDDASITFNAKFYSAIATGRSVQDAFERARVALRLEYPAEGEILELLHRPDVDPGKIVLVSRFRRYARVAIPATVGLALIAAFATAVSDPPVLPPVEPPLAGELRLGDCTSEGTPRPAAYRPLATASMEPGSPSDAATALAQAKAFCHAGNYDSAVAYFKRAAEEGQPEAMSFLGIAYLSGEGAARDSVRGMRWLSEAAKKKRNPHGMYALAVVYENDQRMSRRYYLARHWYGEAAKRGHAEAMRNLGRHYRTGVGIDRSDSAALEWYRRAAVAGSVDALAEIGWMHEQGLDGRSDVAEAIRWYRRAAAAGSPLGMYRMGRAYQGAVGVPRDYEQARAWFGEGACAGSASAMNELGVLYEQGLGVAADEGTALQWFRRAAAAGSPEGARNVARLKPRGVRTAIALLNPPKPVRPAGCAASRG